MTTTNKPMTGEQLDELMTVAVNMQRDSEKAGERPGAMFAYAVQVAVLELRKVRDDAAALAAENAGLKKYICDECYVENIKTGATKCAGRGMPETPATDSFLAEVRAQESAPLVRALTVIANSEQHDGETVVCDFDTLISVAAGALRDHYAAQLRKGVQS